MNRFPTPVELCDKVEHETIVDINIWLQKSTCDLYSLQSVSKLCETTCECQYIKNLLVEAGWIVTVVGCELKISIDYTSQKIKNQNQSDVYTPKQILKFYKLIIHNRFLNIIQKHSKELCILKQKIDVSCSNIHEIMIAKALLSEYQWQCQVTDYNILVWM